MNTFKISLRQNTVKKKINFMWFYELYKNFLWIFTKDSKDILNRFDKINENTHIDR